MPGVGGRRAGTQAWRLETRQHTPPGPPPLPSTQRAPAHRYCTPGPATGTTEDTDREHVLSLGDPGFPSTPTPSGGSAHSPRNRCTALTASTSSTTSEKISKSCVHSRARAATVLAPRDLATLREGTRAGAQGRAGELLLLPTAPGLPATPQGPGLRVARVWSSARHRRGVRNFCARK